MIGFNTPFECVHYKDCVRNSAFHPDFSVEAYVNLKLEVLPQLVQEVVLGVGQHLPCKSDGDVLNIAAFQVFEVALSRLPRFLVDGRYARQLGFGESICLHYSAVDECPLLIVRFISTGRSLELKLVEDGVGL